MKNKVATLGLDGMSKNMLLFGIKNGYMPTLKEVLEENSLVLKNMDCIPPLTFPSWTSILTGVNPGKHGIYDFFHYIIDRNQNRWVARIVSSLDLEHPRIHEMMHLLGSNTRSLMINLIPPYPLIPVRNADMLQLGFFTPKITYYPEKLGVLFEDEITSIEKLKHYKVEGCKVIKKSIRLLDIYKSLVEKAIYRKYDLLWIQIQIPDSIFHNCYVAVKKPDMLKGVFMKIDEIFKFLVDHYDHILVVSDHGFKYYEKRIAINRVLYENGFIVETRNRSEFIEKEYTDSKSNRKELHISKNLYKLINFKPMRPIAKIVYSIYTRIQRKLGRRVVLLYNTGIDYIRSKAFIPADRASAPPRFYIIINQNGNTIKKVKEVLMKYGIKSVEPEKIFSGPYVYRAPGLVIIPKSNEEYWYVPGTIYTEIIVKKGIANHSRYGVFGIYTTSNELYNTINKLEEPLPNTLPAPIAMNLFKLPISSQTDHLELIKNIFPDVRTVEIVNKWRIYKKLLKIRTH